MADPGGTNSYRFPNTYAGEDFVPPGFADISGAGTADQGNEGARYVVSGHCSELEYRQENG